MRTVLGLLHLGLPNKIRQISLPYFIGRSFRNLIFKDLDRCKTQYCQTPTVDDILYEIFFVNAFLVLPSCRGINLVKISNSHFIRICGSSLSGTSWLNIIFVQLLCSLSDLDAMFLLTYRLCLLFPSLSDFSCRCPFLCSTSPPHLIVASPFCLCPILSFLSFHVFSWRCALERTLLLPSLTPPLPPFLFPYEYLGEVIHDHFS